ncbi:MAG: hypothetical protein ABFR82_01440 [Nitrospirota bacterium]
MGSGQEEKKEETLEDTKEEEIKAGESNDEIVTIIKRIIAVNKINAEKVSKMKDGLLKNVSTLHNSTKAVRAYQTSSY